MGNANIILNGHKTEQDRLKDVLNKNGYLETEVVLNKSYFLRSREVEKEIQPKMKYTAATSLERV